MTGNETRPLPAKKLTAGRDGGDDVETVREPYTTGKVTPEGPAKSIVPSNAAKLVVFVELLASDISRLVSGASGLITLIWLNKDTLTVAAAVSLFSTQDWP